MKRMPLCPGYFERDVQEIIEQHEVDFCKFYCALCGQSVIPKRKDGGWVPQNHPLTTEQEL
jgi:hypothetical protein